MRRSRGFPYGVGLVKNRYIGCTFITPDQRSREQAVRIKLGALRSCVEGRRVVMIDDSIVRGTTSRRAGPPAHLRTALHHPLLLRDGHSGQ